MSIAWIGGNFSTTDIVIVFAAMIYGLGYASYKPELIEMAYRFVAKAFFHEPLIDAEFLLDKRPQDVCTELTYIEKIGYFIIPLMIVFFIISEIATYSINTWNQFLAPFFGNISLEKLRTITTILIMFDLPLAAFFVFIFSTSFRFYFAQFNPETVYENPIDNEQRWATMIRLMTIKSGGSSSR
jgi:Ni,Fe-hydrogenase I cytochrome b subunit